MANYNIVAESSFTPFTFEELLKPAMMASEAHLLMEKEYDTLLELASTLEKLANQSRNTAEYNTYKLFSEDLKSLADALASLGLTLAGRQGIRNLRTKYREQLVPIQEAMQSIEKRAEEQRKLRASNPNLMFDRYFDSDVSIKDMMDNPNLSYSPVSGDDLYKKGIAAGKAASQRMFKDPVLKGQFYQIELGYGREAALQFLKDNTSIEELNESIKDIMSSSGANNLSKADITRATDFIVRGMFDGMDYDVKHVQRPKTASEELTPYQRFLMKSQGYNPDTGDLDKSSPYWTGKDITFDENGNPIPLEKNEKVTTKIFKDKVITVDSKGNTTITELPEEEKPSNKPASERKNMTGYSIEDGTPFYGLYWNSFFGNSPDSLGIKEGMENDYESWYTSGFSKEDSEIISVENLNNETKTTLQQYLAYYNLTLDDVVIYKDLDAVSDNHFRVVLKTAELQAKEIEDYMKKQNKNKPLPAINTDSIKDTVATSNNVDAFL